MKNSSWILALVLALILSCAAGNAASADDIFTLSVSKLTLQIGESQKLTPTVICNCEKHDPSGPVWTSSDPAVAKVSKKGKVTAVSAGKATVRAVWGGRTLKVKVMVKSAEPTPSPEPAATPEPTDPGAETLAGLTETVAGRYAAVRSSGVSPKASGKERLYFIMNSDVCVRMPSGMNKSRTLSGAGFRAEEWKGSGKSGNVALITFVRFSEYQSLTAWKKSLRQSFRNVSPRKVGGVSCVFGYTSLSGVHHQTVIFNRNGVSYGIVLSYAAQEDQANLNTLLIDSLKISNTKIQIDYPSPVLYPFQTLDLTLSDPDDPDAVFTLTSSDGSVLLADDNTLFAQQPGTAKITVRSSSGKKRTVTATVLESPKKISVSPSRLYLTVGETFLSEPSLNISEKASLASSPDYRFVFSSSDTSVATVSSDGLVSAVAPGKARITVTSWFFDLSKSFTVTVTESPEEHSPVTYRALLIGNRAGGVGMLDGPDVDARGMSALLAKTDPAYIRTVKADRSANEILSSIRTVFAGADSNDISLFYYSGHGNRDGSLVGSDGSALSPARLAAALKAVPGRVIVILDSCYSGEMIAKSASADSSPADVANTASAAAMAVAPFRNVWLENAEPYAESGASAKSGALRSSKFLVLASCRAGQLSYSVYGDRFTGVYNGLDFGRKTVGAMTFYLLRAAGYNEQTGAFITPQGTAGDKVLTLKEAFSYTKSSVNKLFRSTGIVQTVTAYPSASEEPLFTLK